MTAPPVTDGGELKVDVDLREEVDVFHPNGRRPEVTSP
jgi:hypothetical protein